MIGRKTLLAIGNLAVGVIFGLVALKLTAIYFGKEAFGDVEFALSILGIIYLFTDLNMADAHVKRVSEGGDEGDYFVTFATFKLVSTLVFIALGASILFGYAIALGRPLQSTTAPVFLLMIGYYVAKSAALVGQSTFEARRETARSQVGSIFETLTRVALVALFAYTLAALVHNAGPLVGYVHGDHWLWSWVVQHPPAALALTFTASAVVNAIVTLALTARTLKRGTFRWDILRSYWRFALPLFLVSTMGIVSAYIDRVALGFFGSNVDAGDFGGLRRIIMVIDGLGLAVGLLLFPTLSSMAAQGDKVRMHQMVDTSTRYLSLLIVPMSAFLIAFPGFTITLILDNAWLGNQLTLSILALWVLITTLARPQVNLLMGVNRPDVMAKIGLATAGINIILNLILIPEDIKLLNIRLFGLYALGAAIATLISGIAYYAMLTHAARNIAGYRPKVAFGKHFFAAGAMSVILFAMDTYGPLPLMRWYSLPVYTVVGGFVYGLCLVIMKELTRADYEYALTVLHPGEMWRYLKTELLHRRS